VPRGVAGLLLPEPGLHVAVQLGSVVRLDVAVPESPQQPFEVIRGPQHDLLDERDVEKPALRASSHRHDDRSDGVPPLFVEAASQPREPRGLIF